MKKYGEKTERVCAAVHRRYVDIVTEAGFKAVFGDKRNKGVLMDFLNVVLPPHRRVRSITYSTTEIPGFTFGNKSVRLDLRCTGDDGTEFIVEMQCYSQDNFFRRCVEYAAKVYDSGSRRGDMQEYDLRPVYFIAIMGKEAGLRGRDGIIWSDRFISEYTFREKLTGEVPEETIFLIFVELNRFDKPLGECTSLSDKWCYALKHVGTLDELPGDLKAEAFERLFEACEVAKFDRERKLIYENDMITERDYNNIINTARRDGEKKGKAEGIAAVAKSMKAKGYPMPEIESLTGLTKVEIEAL